MEMTMKAKRKRLKDDVRRQTFTAPTVSRTPIEWWRFKHADGFDESVLDDLRRTIGRLDMLGEPRWKSAAGGDAASAIGIVFGMRPEESHRARFDLAMTALVNCAAAGNSSACLVVAHVLRRLPAAGKTEARIATIWLVKAFGKISSRRRGAVKGKSAGDQR
jgi:hypothetical protein